MKISMNNQLLQNPGRRRDKKLAQPQRLPVLRIQRQLPTMLKRRLLPPLLTPLQLRQHIPIQIHNLEPLHLALLPIQQQPIIRGERALGTPTKLLQNILGQKFEDHAGDEVGLLLLVAAVPDVGEVEADLLNVLQALVAGVEEGGEAVVVGRAEIEGDMAVEGFDGEGVELFVH